MKWKTAVLRYGKLPAEARAKIQSLIYRNCPAVRPDFLFMDAVDTVFAELNCQYPCCSGLSQSQRLNHL